MAGFVANLQAVFRPIDARLHFPLQAQNRSAIRKIYRAFFDEQADPLPQLRAPVGHVAPHLPDAAAGA